MSELKDKLLKGEYKTLPEIKQSPILALLDVSEEESKFLKELGMETIEDLATKWHEYYDNMAKKIPKERINSWIAASRMLSMEETEKVTSG
ncbi:hypothetical protein EU534_00860, partial [Candidatus Heimdallarchaeota archaeon]